MVRYPDFCRPLSEGRNDEDRREGAFARGCLFDLGAWVDPGRALHLSDFESRRLELRPHPGSHLTDDGIPVGRTNQRHSGGRSHEGRPRQADGDDEGAYEKSIDA